MALLIVLIILLLIGLIPIGVNAAYDENGAALRLIAGPVRVTVYPKAKAEINKAKQSKSESKSESTKQNGGNYKDFVPLLQLVLELLADLRCKIRVNHLRLNVVLCDEDPCDLAVNYGRAWAALGNLMPQLERIFVIKKRDLEVQCDFTGNKVLVLFGADITITVGRLLVLGIRHGVPILREYLKIMNNRKGGANV